MYPITNSDEMCFSLLYSGVGNLAMNVINACIHTNVLYCIETTLLLHLHAMVMD